ncbi:MAG: cupin domain-containing protein [Candidatus Limnocylindria bacterium]
MEVVRTSEWIPVTTPGATKVEVRPLLRTGGVGLALLRFGPHGSTDEHSAEYDIDVVCLEGAGFTKLGSEVALLREGDRIQWPRRIVHGLGTTNESMVTLMVEHR